MFPALLLQSRQNIIQKTLPLGRRHECSHLLEMLNSRLFTVTTKCLLLTKLGVNIAILAAAMPGAP
jgi:hypothetical protein